jgi:hypothetical protein
MPAATRPRSLSFALAAIALVASPRVARADSPAPDTYFIQVDSNTVRICVSNGTRQCPGGGDLLRENALTGTAVKLAEFCTTSGCYLDECVPQGTYRYGYLEPLACQSSSGTYYFDEAAVATPLGTCERSAGNAAPTAYPGALPWTDDPVKCESTYGKCGCSVSRSSSSAQLGVFVIQGIALVAGIFFWRRRRTGSR